MYFTCSLSSTLTDAIQSERRIYNRLLSFLNIIFGRTLLIFYPEFFHTIFLAAEHNEKWLFLILNYYRSLSICTCCLEEERVNFINIEFLNYCFLLSVKPKHSRAILVNSFYSIWRSCQCLLFTPEEEERLFFKDSNF